MTQEELDALMEGDIDEASVEPSDSDTSSSADAKVMAASIAGDGEIKSSGDGELPKDFRVNASSHWPPPPPTADHKMVRQLDDVTKDSEEKATQVLDMLDVINNALMDGESAASNVKELLNKNVEVFSKLMAKYPHIATFVNCKEENQNALNSVDEIIEKFQEGQDHSITIMDMMQYQDIHRQKIERVINVMRALSRYMNSLFESDIDDRKRVPSAVHLEGDKTENLMSDDDIEALINSLGKK